MLTSITNLLEEIVNKETGTPTGNANIKGGVVILILLAGLLVPDILVNIVNFFLNLIFKLTIPDLPDSVIVYFVTILVVYFTVSYIIVAKVETKTKL